MINGDSSNGYYTLAEGVPYKDSTTTVQLRPKNDGRVGGLMLMQDTQLIETLAHFSRERIPERVVHASAAGAYGYLEVTHDNSDITSAAFLNGIGKKTDILLRISTVGPERGSADTIRDPRGWGMKIYTEEGNQDFVFNNTPVFFIRDPIKFPSLNRSHKRNPRTNSPDPNMFWDFHLGSQEGMHELMHLFSDRGTPASLRHMHAFSGHTYKFTKEDGTFNYVKIHIKTTQGVKTFTEEEATEMAGKNPNHNAEDLYKAIEEGNYPTWTINAQVMSPEQAESFRFNIFDMTKVWPQAEFPLRQIAKMTLNRNPSNYFTDIEQAAFSPSNMVPGIAPSADPMLQARMFAYPDAARYRVGPNYQMLPTNAAKSPVYSPYQRDGPMNFTRNYGQDPNYVRSSIKPTPFYTNGAKRNFTTITEHERWVGEVSSFTSEITDEDFVQPRGLWRVLGKTPGQQENYVKNISGHIAGVTDKDMRLAVFDMFRRVEKKLGDRIEEATERIVEGNKKGVANGHA